MILKVGSSGDDVKKLQAKLGLDDDGDFGLVTEKSVKAWQSANGLTANGIVDNVTWNKIFSANNTASSSAFKLEALKGHIPSEVLQGWRILTAERREGFRKHP